MGGEGFIFHMIRSLQMNSRKRDSMFGKKGGSVHSKTKKKFVNKEATPEVLERVRNKTRKKEKREILIKTSVPLLTLLAVIVLYLLLQN